MKNDANKRDGVYSGETRTITHPSLAPNPNEPRPDDVKATSFALGNRHPAPHG